jgi:hypothetical protein
MRVLGPVLHREPAPAAFVLRMPKRLAVANQLRGCLAPALRDDCPWPRPYARSKASVALDHSSMRRRGIMRVSSNFSGLRRLSATGWGVLPEWRPIAETTATKRQGGGMSVSHHSQPETGTPPYRITLSAITPCSPTSISVTPLSPIRGASRQNCRCKHWLPGVGSVRSTGLHVPLALLKDVPWPNSTS